MADTQLDEVMDLVRSSPVDFADPPHQARAAFEEMFAEVPRPAAIRYEAAEVGGVRGLWARVGDTNGDRAVIYLHGGGFVIGSANAYAALAGSLAEQTGIDTFIVDYRLAPEHPYPAAHEDVFGVYRSMLAAGMKSVAVAGDSAGGALLMSLLLWARSRELRQPACAVLWSPWLNPACDSDSYRRNADIDPTLSAGGLRTCVQRYLGMQIPDDEALWPLRADLTGLPPLLIQTGSIEILLDDATTLARRAADADVYTRLEVYPGLPHVFQAFAGLLPQAAQALGESAAFVRAATTQPS